MLPHITRMVRKAQNAGLMADAKIESVVESEHMQVARITLDDPESNILWTFALPHPVKPEAMVWAKSYLPRWALLDAVEQTDGWWCFHFSAASRAAR